ncbi:hypothetical protein BC941DRAFT_512777 [Chlamydoabsidia padenii]|nr:hypothetical protein BC941DRAFT_512777 [Chlamydoabsidia padenii]
MRLAVYGAISTTLATSVILSAFTHRVNFYAACVYLSKSSACMMILMNMGLFISIIAGKSLQAVFFGRLRAIEVEHLYERSWYAVTETCLAMTIFREEFNIQFVVFFTTLLFLKIFHWLCQDRVEFMDQTPTHGRLFHGRMVSMMILLFLLDYSLAMHAIQATWTKGPNMMIMFGFEYTIMLCSILSSICKYIINVIDLRSQEPWEGKSMHVFFVDLFTDFFKLLTYVIFFVIICFYYQLPLHIVRDVYVTFRSFIQKCRDLYRYRRATRNMDQLYPDASLDDLSQSSDSTCIICREEMLVAVTNPVDRPKKLPCGHIFHFHCLRSWLERQQTCPTCRRSVLSEDNNNNSTTPPPQHPPNNNNNNNINQQETQHQTPDQDHSTHDRHLSEHSSGTSASYHPTSATFGIYGPSQPYNTALPIHGLIPLAPLGTTTNTTTPLPEELTRDQLATLSTNTRQGMEERLRVLEIVQSQIFSSMQYLASALSALPNDDDSQPTRSQSILTSTPDQVPSYSTRVEDVPDQEPSSSSSSISNEKGKMRSMDGS